MENQEMVMEKSWKNILSSLWEPCNMLVFTTQNFHVGGSKATHAHTRTGGIQALSFITAVITCHNSARSIHCQIFWSIIHYWFIVSL